MSENTPISPINYRQRELRKMFGDTMVAPPVPEQSNDAVFLHDYFVADYLLKLAKQRHDDAKKIASDMFIDADVDAIHMDSAVTTEIGNMRTVKETNSYTMTVAYKKPAKTLDQALLRNNMAKAGLTTSQIDAIIEASKKANKPARTVSVVPR